MKGKIESAWCQRQGAAQYGVQTPFEAPEPEAEAAARTLSLGVDEPVLLAKALPCK